MEIKEAKADLKKRKGAVVAEINQVAAQQQQLAERLWELIKEADMLNGEDRLLKRLDGNTDKSQKP